MPVYVPIKDICEELTAYGFSYKWGNCNPIIQPWRLVEAKAKKAGMLFEGERAIRGFWEENVRAKLPEAFYKKRDLMDRDWVMEARRRCGFDGPDYKDRFATGRRKQAAAVAPPSLGSSSSTSSSVDDTNDALSAAQAVKPPSAAVAQSTAAAAFPPPCPTDPEPAASVVKRRGDEVDMSDTVFEVKKAHELLFGPLRKEGGGGGGHKAKKRKKLSSSSSSSSLEAAEGSSSSCASRAPRVVDAAVAGGREGGDHSNSSSNSSRNALAEVLVPKDNGRVLNMRIAGASWMEPKAQRELFQALFAKSSTLTPLQLEHTTVMLQKGDPKVIGLLKAYKGRDDAKSLSQFQRIVDTIVSDSPLYGHPKLST